MKVAKLGRLGSVVLVVAMLAGCAAPLLPATAPETQVAPERVTVERGPIENHVIANGHVVAERTVSLAFSRAGHIAVVNAREGEWVKQGQLLARLDTRELEFIAKQQKAAYIGATAQYSLAVRGGSPFDIQLAQMEYASANQRLKDLSTGPTQAQVAELQLLVQQAEADVKRAQADYDNAYRNNPSGITASPEAAALEARTIALQAVKARLSALYEKPKAGQFAELRTQAAAAQAKLNALKPVAEALVSSKAAVDQAYIAWQMAEQNLRDTRIIAPFDGLVTRVGMSAGDMAGSNSAIELADFNQPLFEANVDEADLAKIKVGQQARVRLQTYIDTPLDAEVKSISKVGQQVGSLTVYRVRLLLGPASPPGDENSAEPAADAGVDANADVAGEVVPTPEPNAEVNAEQSADPASEPAANASEGASAGEESSATTEILLNMSGTAQFVTAISEDALLAPANAVTHNPEDNIYTVQVVTSEGSNEKINEIEIEVGLRNGEMFEVISGLKEGDVLNVPAPENVPLEGPSVN